MNKSLVLAIGILALIALSVWFFTNPATLPGSDISSATSSIPTTTTPAAVKPPVKPAAKPPAEKGVQDSQETYKSLLTQTGSYQCDYDQVQATGKSHHVIYIYGGKMRGEFRTDTNGVATANLFVYDGRYVYQWKEGTSAGTKTVLNSLSELPFAIPKDLTSGAIVGNNYENAGWLCRTWLTNKSLLAPPSYVSF